MAPFPQRKIYLVGLPGSGKSTLGRKLSDRLSHAFIDLDEEIERSSHASIPELFENLGEESFRDLENETLQTVSKHVKSFVMATGGGTPCFHHNMSFMNAHGITVFLNPQLDGLADRIQQDHRNERPLFAGKNTRQEIISQLKNLLTNRKSFYEEADLVIDSQEISTSLQQIEAFLKSL